jgi:phosphoglycolate phosphatase
LSRPDLGSRQRGARPATAFAAVIFDLDGTLLDSAEGIVAGFQHAMTSVGFEPPDVATLRSDLGPPADILLTSFGVPRDRLDDAVKAYRRFYLGTGLAMSRPYPGISLALEAFDHSGVRLGVATAKRTDLAHAVLAHHDLLGFFDAISGADDAGVTKSETLAHTLRVMDSPGQVVMVGDRHSDIAAARACGVRAVGVSWGYGSVAELTAAGAEWIANSPADLVTLARTGISAD